MQSPPSRGHILFFPQVRTHSPPFFHPANSFPREHAIIPSIGVPPLPRNLRSDFSSHQEEPFSFSPTLAMEDRLSISTRYAVAAHPFPFAEEATLFPLSPPPSLFPFYPSMHIQRFSPRLSPPPHKIAHRSCPPSRPRDRKMMFLSFFFFKLRYAVRIFLSSPTTRERCIFLFFSLPYIDDNYEYAMLDRFNAPPRNKDAAMLKLSPFYPPPTLLAAAFIPSLFVYIISPFPYFAILY